MVDVGKEEFALPTQQEAGGGQTTPRRPFAEHARGKKSDLS